MVVVNVSESLRPLPAAPAAPARPGGNPPDLLLGPGRRPQPDATTFGGKTCYQNEQTA